MKNIILLIFFLLLGSSCQEEPSPQLFEFEISGKRYRSTDGNLQFREEYENKLHKNNTYIISNLVGTAPQIEIYVKDAAKKPVNKFSRPAIAVIARDYSDPTIIGGIVYDRLVSANFEIKSVSKSGIASGNFDFKLTSDQNSDTLIVKNGYFESEFSKFAVGL